MDKYKVVEFDTVDEFRAALKAEFHCGWYLHSWNIDGTWGIVAVLEHPDSVPQRIRPTWGELWRD